MDHKDGDHGVVEGNLSTSINYESTLERILSAREDLSPIPQVKVPDH